MPQKSHGVSPWIAPVFLFYAMLLGGGLAVVWRYCPTKAQVGNDPTAKARPIAPAGERTSVEKSRIEVFGKAKDSVVHIASARLVRNRFTTDVQQVPKGTGTGFIWDEKGRVVTNYH